ncbi:MAG: lactate racemase domain-containing protein [Desulfobacterales bacterium]|nr:lactate racemase domain-containing protein [Desulfobacterales bacterium]
MQQIRLDYGDTTLSADLPDTAVVVEYGKIRPEPEGIDPAAAVRKALDSPHGFPPLRELGGPNKKIVIAFPDRVKGGAHKNAHRRVSIPIILEELIKGGTKLENITLLCAIGLHRKNTLEEWYGYLGRDIVNQFYPDRLVNHDAESEDLCRFGTDEMGNTVQCNRLAAEADLAIVIGHCAGNPYGGYSGGYKMIATGISGWQSIGSHHCPQTMYRQDWMGASTASHMRQQFESIGKAMEAGIGKKFFAVDAVLNQHSDVIAVEAGELGAVEKATWPVADQRTRIYLDTDDPADLLVMGLPRNFHYGPGMGSNPILMSLAVSGQLSRCWHAFRPGGVIIAAAVCDGWFNDAWFPSYEATYEALQQYCTPAEFLASEDARAIVENYEYRFRYSNHYTYHPFHAMSMISGGAVANIRADSVFIVGPKAPRYVRGMGFTPVSTFDEAMQLAQKRVGTHPRILCTPNCFTSGIPAHLYLKQ